MISTWLVVNNPEQKINVEIFQRGENDRKRTFILKDKEGGSLPTYLQIIHFDIIPCKRRRWNCNASI